MQAKMLILLWLAMNSFISMAHGDLHQRIQLVSAEIQKYPNDLELYFKRGSLYLQHESYRKAISDFKHCIKNGHATFKHHFFFS